jgi:hypothetical protein
VLLDPILDFALVQPACTSKLIEGP